MCSVLLASESPYYLDLAFLSCTRVPFHVQTKSWPLPAHGLLRSCDSSAGWGIGWVRVSGLGSFLFSLLGIFKGICLREI